MQGSSLQAIGDAQTPPDHYYALRRRVADSVTTRSKQSTATQGALSGNDCAAHDRKRDHMSKADAVTVAAIAGVPSRRGSCLIGSTS